MGTALSQELALDPCPGTKTDEVQAEAEAPGQRISGAQTPDLGCRRVLSPARGTSSSFQTPPKPQSNLLPSTHSGELGKGVTSDTRKLRKTQPGSRDKDEHLPPTLLPTFPTAVSPREHLLWRRKPSQPPSPRARSWRSSTRQPSWALPARAGAA